MLMRKKSNRTADAVFLILTLLLLGLSVFIFIRCTPYGVGLVSDSVNYINGARSLAEGNGYYRESGGGTLKPITNFPPLYSMVLSLPLSMGIDWVRAVWWVSLVFFVLNQVLVLRLIDLASGCRWAGLLGSALMLCLRPWLYYHFYAMSEPIYFCCTLLAFLFLVKGCKSSSTVDWFLCGLACGGAFLARYVGIVSLCAIFGAILIFIQKKRGQAFAGLFGGAIPCIFAWLVRNSRTTGSVANRQMLTHWVTQEELLHGVCIFWRWLWPARYGNIETPTGWMVQAFVIFLCMALLFCLCLMVAAGRRDETFHEALIFSWTGMLFILGYLLFVVLTISLFDASVNIEERILFPAFMVLCWIGPVSFGIWLRRKEYHAAVLILLVILFFGVVFAQDTSRHTGEMAESGYGWGWEGWQDSPAMKVIRELPPETVIYSNQIEAVSLWAGRGAYALLDPVDPSSEQVREGYEDTMNEIRRQVNDGEAVLVFFGVQDWVDGENWVTQLCDELPYLYQDTSEWVLGK